jgi:isochorismate pyruvate lyase
VRADDAANHPAYWGSPSVDGGKCCTTLMQVRDNIDRIDHAIVALMAERGKYVAEAGRFKPDPAAVSAPARVDAVIAKVRADAEAQGLDPAVAERAYRAMIAASRTTSARNGRAGRTQRRRSEGAPRHASSFRAGRSPDPESGDGQLNA